MDLLIATKNPGKFNEIVASLAGLPVKFLSLKDLGIEADFDEVGESFEQIALDKARFYAGLSGLPTVADDSGIIVEALAGELGLKTRRWGAGAEASDEEWLAHFMQRMKDEKNRKAKFICAAAWSSPDNEKVFLGEAEGMITETVEAPIQGGIPLSSVFKPLNYAKVYSALSADEKKEISHRGKAFKSLLDYAQTLRF